MKKLKGLMAFVMVVSILLVGSVMALPTITVTIQKAAMGENTISAPVNQASVNLVPTSDGLKLAAVSVKFDQTLQAGSVVYAYAYDSNGTLLDSGKASITADLAAGSAVQVTMSNTPSLANVDKIQIIVFGPQI